MNIFGVSFPAPHYTAQYIGVKCISKLLSKLYFQVRLDWHNKILSNNSALEMFEYLWIFCKDMWTQACTGAHDGDGTGSQAITNAATESSRVESTGLPTGPTIAPLQEISPFLMHSRDLWAFCLVSLLFPKPTQNEQDAHSSEPQGNWAPGASAYNEVHFSQSGSLQNILWWIWVFSQELQGVS